MKKTLKVLIIVLVILAAIFAGLFILFKSMSSRAQELAAASAERYTVTSGDLSLTAVGSGKISSADVKTVIPQGSVKEIKVSVGDYVRVGDTLAVVVSAVGSESEFTSEYEGVVTSVPGSSSSAVFPSAQSSSAGFEISSSEKLELIISCTEKDIYKITGGQKASVYIDALNLTIDGEVSRVSLYGQTSGDFSVYDVTVSFNKGNNSIFLGMTGSAKILIETKTKVLKIPADALIEKGDKRYVLKSAWLDNITAPQSDYYAEVKTGLSDADYIEITEGLGSGDEILIITGSANAFSGFMRPSGD